MRFPRIAPVICVAGLAASVACSSSSGPKQDPGLTSGGGGTGEVQGNDKNPYGVAYPSDHLGFAARKGATAGDRVKNFKFVGYPDADRSKGLQPISLADYFDPEGRSYKIIHVSVAGVWCTWCQAEVKALVPLVPQLKDKKVIYLTALSEDISHKPAQQSDLNYWCDVYKPNYTQVLDPGNAELGPFFTSAGIPWNGNFDARTMEVLSSITSAPSSDGVTIDIMGDINPWLDWYDKNRPSYP
jgi:hypothetical protein